MCANESLTLEVICDWLRAAGHPIQTVHAVSWCARMSKAGGDHPCFSMKLREEDAL